MSAVRGDKIAQGGNVYCSKCGSNLADDATFCSRCGAQMGLTPALAPAGAVAPLTAEAPVAVAPPGYIVSGQAVYVQPLVLYAGFWLRVLAYCIDTIILGVFAVPILIGAAMAMGIGGLLAGIPRNQDPFQNGMPPAFFLFMMLCVAIGVFGTWLYFALWKARNGRAPQVNGRSD